jgi:DNA mismatch repair protein MutL
MQYFFLNGRSIRDRSLQHALGEAYRGLLMTGRYAIAFLSLTMPPEMVDVNVHPTKLEVRFQDSGRLYSQLLSTLRGKFLSTDLSTRVQPATERDPSGAHDDARAAQLRRELVDWAKGKLAAWELPGGGEAETAQSADSDPGRGSASRSPLELTRLQRSWGPPRDEARAAPQHAEPGPRDAAAAAVWGGSPGGAGGSSIRALQIHNRYLVAETQEGVTIIDQHALHERILYEQLHCRILAGTIESQSLLVPEPVDLGAAEAAAAWEHRDLLAELGIKIEPFGGDTVLVAGFPAMLANLSPVEVLRELLGRLLSGEKRPDRRDLLDDLLHTIACKAAIKAGDRLSPEEIAALLEQRHLIDDAHHCPHGRPAALVLTREELDKQFKR